jgi:hypothetical protein
MQRIHSETVEKAPKQTVGRDAEKNDFTESATINDLTIMKGRPDPPKSGINYTEGFFDSLSRYRNLTRTQRVSLAPEPVGLQ